MMDKHEFVKILADDGIEAEVVDGIVMLTVTEEQFRKPTKIKRYVARTGFTGSWGMRYRHDAVEAPVQDERGREQRDKGQRYVVHRRRRGQLLCGQDQKHKDDDGQKRKGKRRQKV